MNSVVTAEQLLQEDLAKSGLKTNDLDAYLADEAELTSVGIRSHLYLNSPGVTTPGFVIPYYDISGQRAPFYRVKLFRPLPKGARYLQPQNSGSWLYYPKTFGPLARTLALGRGRTKINGFPGAIILTEGEKKAAKACLEGFPTCAVGGVYNWRSRSVILPEGTLLTKNRDNQIVAKMESGTTVDPTSDRRAFLANGLESLIKYIMANNLQIVIAFDSDNPRNNDVEAAAAELAFELRIHGVPTHRIRQLHLPAEPGRKIGLDDFLVSHTSDALDNLLEKVCEVKNAFPAHPNLKELINKRMAGNMARNEAKELSLMILSDMDRHGQRMIEKNTDTPFFFDGRSKSLLRVNLMQHHSEPLHETKFGKFLYRTYDAGQADLKLIQWLASGFTGEEPVSMVEPRSVLALLPGNRIAHQIDDGHFSIIGGDPKNPIAICENGSENLLFKADQVEPVDRLKLIQEVKKQIAWLESKPTYRDLYWPMALRSFKFARDTDAKVMSVLSYMSPWLQRWNGAQLPVELMVGEPGSGKSSLYSLRLQILNGRPALRNQPTDVRDWYASIVSQDGLHVVDNVHMVNKDLRQRLSDEICRIVTEPAPYIEMRKLFTTTDNYRLPVRTVFAFTAIQQPFMSADILQRSMIMELQAIGREHDSDWAGGVLESFGGRICWLAHQLAVMHMFFRKVNNGGWNNTYKSGHRLAHFEQLFRIIGGIIGLPDAELLGATLVKAAEAQVSEYDWTMEALKAFATEHLQGMLSDPRLVFTIPNVSEWAQTREEFTQNQTVIDARRLSRYVKSHKYMVEKVCGFVLQSNKHANRDAYRLQKVT